MAQPDPGYQQPYAYGQQQQGAHASSVLVVAAPSAMSLCACPWLSLTACDHPCVQGMVRWHNLEAIRRSSLASGLLVFLRLRLLVLVRPVVEDELVGMIKPCTVGR